MSDSKPIGMKYSDLWEKMLETHNLTLVRNEVRLGLIEQLEIKLQETLRIVSTMRDLYEEDCQTAHEMGNLLMKASEPGLKILLEKEIKER